MRGDEGGGRDHGLGAAVGLDRADRLLERLGPPLALVGHEFSGLPLELRQEMPGGATICLERPRSPGEVAAPPLLVHDCDGEVHALANPEGRQQFQAPHPDVVGKHLAAGSRLPDRLQDVGHELSQFAGREPAIEGGRTAADPAVLGVHHGADRRDQQRPVGRID